MPAIITLAVTTLIIVLIVLSSKYFELQERIDDMERRETDFVVCEKSKLILRKEDAYKVKVIKSFKFFSLTKEYRTEDLVTDDREYIYYSPLYAPEYDCIDERFTPPVYTKTVKESQVEVKVPKSK